MKWKYATSLAVAMLAMAAPAKAAPAVSDKHITQNEKAVLSLPIHVMKTRPTKDTLAILYSGDGGWSTIDKVLGNSLRKEGIPVVGMDSLRYFWSERTANETARDLGRLIDTYTERFKVKHVVLIGYSFGADIMPASYNRLRPDQKARVLQISLLALSHKVDYAVSIRGWLGLETEGKGGDPVRDVKSIDARIVQCIYGKTDTESAACPQLKATGVDVVGLAGGHHFNGDYVDLARHIMDDLKPRLKVMR